MDPNPARIKVVMDPNTRVGPFHNTASLPPYPVGPADIDCITAIDAKDRIAANLQINDPVIPKNTPVPMRTRQIMDIIVSDYYILVLRPYVDTSAVDE